MPTLCGLGTENTAVSEARAALGGGVALQRVEQTLRFSLSGRRDEEEKSEKRAGRDESSQLPVLPALFGRLGQPELPQPHP